jgi:hypothetical protein
LFPKLQRMTVENFRNLALEVIQKKWNFCFDEMFHQINKNKIDLIRFFTFKYLMLLFDFNFSIFKILLLVYFLIIFTSYSINSIPHPFHSLSFPSSSISLSSILSPFHLHSIFLPVPFPLSLSHFATSIPHVLDCLSLLKAHSTPSFLCVFSLLVSTSESRHHFSFSCTFSPHVLRPAFPLSYSELYPNSLILSLLSCLSVSLSILLSSTFIHLSFALNLSTYSLAYPFLSVYFSLSLSFFSVFFFFSLQHSLSIRQALFLTFTPSLFLLHSSLTV